MYRMPAPIAPVKRTNVYSQIEIVPTDASGCHFQESTTSGSQGEPLDRAPTYLVSTVYEMTVTNLSSSHYPPMASRQPAFLQRERRLLARVGRGDRPQESQLIGVEQKTFAQCEVFAS
jgi:hypothetical protein